MRGGQGKEAVFFDLLGTYPSLREDISCEVAVLGGGITGALTAYHLAREGIDTVVIDQRDVGTGSTAASTALLQHAADTELVELASLVGEQAAVRSYRLGLEAVKKIEKLVDILGDPCGYERKPSLYLASAQSHVPKLLREFHLRKKNGFEVEYWEEKQIGDRFTFQAPAAILAQGDAQIDAFRFTHRLLERATKNGLRVFDRTQIDDIESRRDCIVLTSAQGYTIKARRLVFATGYESQRYLQQKIGDLYSTFVVITEPVDPFPPWEQACLIWETARPYCYLRSTDDGRILIGGKDTPYATAHRQQSLLKRKTRQLEERLERMFPESELETAYSWAGTFGTTADGLPYIGVSKEWPLAYFALGYGGNGITMSLMAAELIVDQYLGRKNPDARLFAFDR